MCCESFSKSQCSEYSHKKIVVAQEKKCEYRAHNIDRKKLCKVKIDGSYITDGRKCDYLIINCNDTNAYLIELKGTDVFHGIEQIESTISRLQGELAKCKIFSRIVLKKVSVPDLENNPKILRHKKIIKKLGGNFAKATCQFNEYL
jgi:hypothetical protein